MQLDDGGPVRRNWPCRVPRDTQTAKEQRDGAGGGSAAAEEQLICTFGTTLLQPGSPRVGTERAKNYAQLFIVARIGSKLGGKIDRRPLALSSGLIAIANIPVATTG